MVQQLERTTMEFGLGVDLDEVSVMDRRRVLVVEDDADTVFLLKQILRRNGYNVLSASDGVEGLQKVSENRPDLILLDLMMPQMDGWQMIQFLRQISAVPVIIVSALQMKENVVQALQGGADDYITKPFYNDEVAARVSAVLRRTQQPQEVSRLVFPQIGLVIDKESQEVIYQGKTIQLTAKEFAVLSVLAKHAPAIVSYRVIAQSVWGESIPEVRERTKYLVYLLRRKLSSIAPEDKLIQNVGRLGYKLQTER